MSLTRNNKLGLALALLLGLSDLPAFTRSFEAGVVGPPRGVLIVETICGVVTVIALLIAWRSANARAMRVAAGARIISMLTALPAFFVSVPTNRKLLLAAVVALTIASVVLILTPSSDTSRREVTP